ncbi:hypothetical protein ACERII_00250 [Evansella sp. AB-rgal1]|uniref:hypothetical protein n=1 Tax=Evansella sp. AB-rgal1 TaxID=3242696 RepID=UPI00359D47B3
MTNTNNDTFTHKQVAVNCFNKVWTYLGKQERTEEAELMIHLSHTSFWHWSQVEDYSSQNLSVTEIYLSYAFLYKI